MPQHLREPLPRDCDAWCVRCLLGWPEISFPIALGPTRTAIPARTALAHPRSCWGRVRRSHTAEIAPSLSKNECCGVAPQKRRSVYLPERRSAHRCHRRPMSWEERHSPPSARSAASDIERRPPEPKATGSNPVGRANILDFPKKTVRSQSVGFRQNPAEAVRFRVGRRVGRSSRAGRVGRRVGSSCRVAALTPTR